MKTQIENLKPGQSLLYAIRQYKDGYGICVAQMRENQPTNVTALLNASDERFKQSQPKAQQAWARSTAEDIKKLFNIDVNALSFDQKDSAGNAFALVGILNPTVNGKRLIVQSVDSLVPQVGKTTYSVKRLGKIGTDSEFIPTYEGKPIYNRKNIGIEGESKNVVINKTGQMSPAEYEAYVASHQAEPSMTA